MLGADEGLVLADEIRLNVLDLFVACAADVGELSDEARSVVLELQPSVCRLVGGHGAHVLQLENLALQVADDRLLCGQCVMQAVDLDTLLLVFALTVGAARDDRLHDTRLQVCE